jgi:hypothetical protein
VSVTTFLGDILFRVHPETHVCETRWADGKILVAAPEDTDAYRATARRLGYGADTWALCWSHEALHTILAQWQGQRYSLTLRGQAEGQPVAGDVAAWEEWHVTTLQALLNDAGVPPDDWQALARVAVDRLVKDARAALARIEQEEDV